MAGDQVAFVVAETRAQDLDAAELVFVDYEDIEPVIDLTRALDPETPEVWDEFESDLAFHFEKGDRTATGAVFESASRIAGVDLVNNRVVQAAIEPRAADGERFTLTLSGQSIFGQRADLGDNVFQVPRDRIRILAPDVGGGFGAKNFLYPESVLVLWAARRLGGR